MRPAPLCLRNATASRALGASAGGAASDLNRQIGAAADLLRALSGLYDQAARAAASL